MAIYSIITIGAGGTISEVYILDGIEISAAEFAAVQAAAWDRAMWGCE